MEWLNATIEMSPYQYIFWEKLCKFESKCKLATYCQSLDVATAIMASFEIGEIEPLLKINKFSLIVDRNVPRDDATIEMLLHQYNFWAGKAL